MTAPHLTALVAGLAVMLGSSVALANPANPVATVAPADLPLPNGHVRLTTGDGQLVAPGGKVYFLPLGSHILDGTTWQKLDDDVKTTHDQVTRLAAENQSLKNSLSTWQPGWGSLIVLTSLVAIAGGVAWYEH